MTPGTPIGRAGGGGGDADGNCWELARAAAAHYAGGHRLHHNVGAAHEVYQTSTMTALLDAVYDGDITYGELAAHGDFGVGTFNHLDGEMIALDGQFFHLRADGSASPVDPKERTPFAALCFFRGDALEDLVGPIDRPALETVITELIPSVNLFYAIRVEGTFEMVRTRTVARQELPYPRLVEATATQSVVELTNVAGSLVGFRAPDYAQGMTVAGFHFHFINHDRSLGGHVLDLVLGRGTLQVDLESGIHIELPDTPSFLGADLSREDVGAEIE